MSSRICPSLCIDGQTYSEGITQQPKLHCKPIPCNENRVPAMRTGFPCNENRFFPVRKSTHRKPCSDPVLALYRIAVQAYTAHQFFSAVHSIRGLLLKLPFEVLCIFLMIGAKEISIWVLNIYWSFKKF